jgi:Zn-dependent M28 family amino/carboxypeptidase
MIDLLLALPLCVSLPLDVPLDVPPDATGDAADEADEPVWTAWAVFHEGDEGLRNTLTRNAQVWHDAGEFVVGAFTSDLIRGLAARGIDAVEIGPVDSEEDLWLVSQREVDRLGGKLSPLGEEILRTGRTRLISLPAGMHPKAAGGVASPGLHIGMNRIIRKAWKAPRPFTYRGVSPAGGALAMSGVDSRVQALVDQVDKTNLQADVTALSSIFSRRANLSGADTARNMISAWFTADGYSPYLENYSSTYSENVVAEIVGTVHPNDWIVIGAHYDSINGSGSSYAAPGADDNASGTAGVVEVARILQGAGPFERSIRFITFSGEELGLYGSAGSAANSVAAGENIVAMLNTDMNAYRAPGDPRTCDFVTDNGNGALMAFCQAAGALYVPSWASNSGGLSGGSSDHASYHAQGFPAIFFFEDIGSYSPYIHSTNDTVGTSANDWDLAEMIVKGVLAAAVLKAEFVDMQITHTPLADTTDAWGPYPVSANVANLDSATTTSVDLSYSDDGANFTTVSMTSVGGGNWTGDIPSFGSPVTIQYYITAHDDQGGIETAPEGADLGGTPYSFFVGIKNVLHATGFEAVGDEGWTHGQTSTQDDWQRGAPYGNAGDPSSAYEGTKVWGNDLGASGWNGEYASSVANWLKSPVIDCSSAANVLLEFQRQLTVEDGSYDHAEIYVDGTLVWENSDANDHIDSGWTPVSIDVTALAAGDPTVQVEFRLSSDSSVEFGGWNIDDFSLSEQTSSTGNVFLFGSGVNPTGSMSVVSGIPSIGGTVVMGVDNPLGTQGVGSFPFLFISTAPDLNYPAGTLIPGWGMASAGAAGELLISPSVYLTLAGPPWTGAGIPAPIPVNIPNDPAIIGFEVFGQGAIVDPAVTFGIRVGLTEGFVFQIGG